MRQSPFDQAHRRHTAFSTVIVAPLLPDDADVEIDDGDLKIDTYRAQGAGGQHVNKTDSAVRITHLPTGIVVQCQNERSQSANKQTAMRVLKARLVERAEEEREAVMAKERVDPPTPASAASRSAPMSSTRTNSSRTPAPATRSETPRPCSTATSIRSSASTCSPGLPEGSSRAVSYTSSNLRTRAPR